MHSIYTHCVIIHLMQMGNGRFRNGYLKYEAAGDQYVGQCATGKNQLSKSATIYPDYFDFTHIYYLEQCFSMKIGIKRLDLVYAT